MRGEKKEMKKFLITNEVSSFTTSDGKDHRPGEVVALSEDFPAYLYSFLKPTGEAEGTGQKASKRTKP
jgi:hypothetical protein